MQQQQRLLLDHVFGLVYGMLERTSTLVRLMLQPSPPFISPLTHHPHPLYVCMCVYSTAALQPSIYPTPLPDTRERMDPEK